MANCYLVAGFPCSKVAGIPGLWIMNARLQELLVLDIKILWVWIVHSLAPDFQLPDHRFPGFLISGFQIKVPGSGFQVLEIQIS